VQKAAEAKSLALRSKNITHIDDLSTFHALQRLDLTGNSLKTEESLASLSFCHWITWLSVAKNQLQGIQPLCKIKSLQGNAPARTCTGLISVVLNASHNKLGVLPWDELAELQKLKALILNDNQLKAFPPTSSLPKSLDTLVLSSNQLTELPAGLFRRMENLTKVSLSHNLLHDLPDLSECWLLKEVRLAGNRIHAPRDILAKLPASVEILDLGHNQLDDTDTLLAALRGSSLKRICSLNLKGNPCVDDDDGSFLAKLRVVLPELRVFNGRNLLETKKASKRGAYTEVQVKPERQNKNTKVNFD